MATTKNADRTDAQLQQDADAMKDGNDPFGMGKAARDELTRRRGGGAGMTPTEQQDADIGSGLDRIKTAADKTGNATNFATRDYQQARDPIVKNLNTLDESGAQKADRLAEQTRNQASDSRETFTNLRTKTMDSMEDAERNAKDAMSLRDYMNPNNQVMQGTRDLYNNEGALQQGMIEQGANGETRRGQADYGVLSALGAKSAGLGFNGPMTVGQQMAMMSQAQGQAGEAYAAVQKRVQAMRDQGLQTNLRHRDEGINRGFDRNDAAYAAGESARDRARMSRQDVGSVQDQMDNSARAFRDEDNFYTTQGRDIRKGVEGRNLGVAQENLSIDQRRSMDEFSRTYATETARIMEILRKQGRTAAEIQNFQAARAAEMAAEAQKTAAMYQAGGTVAGAVIGAYGGPAGMAAGAAAGGAAGNAVAPRAVAPAQYNGNVGSQYSQPQQAPSSTFGAYLQNKYGQQPRTA